MRVKTLFVLALFIAAMPLAGRAAEPGFDVSVFGNGRPFFMIPGLSSTMEVWDDAAHRYGVQYRVHRFTLAGFGGLKPIPGPFIDRSVAALKAYAEQNDIHNAIIMGHSVGGIIALKLAAEEPDRFTTVIVVDILPFLGGATFGVKDASQAAMVTNRYKAQMLATPPATFLAQQKAQIPTQVGASNKIDMLGHWLHESDVPTIIEATCELYSSDFRPDVAADHARTLVIYAWNPKTNLSPQTLDMIYKAQYAGLPNGFLQRIDNSRHFVMFDQRDAFFRAVDDFLSDPVQSSTSH